MPQQSLLPEYPPMTSLRITIRQLEPHQGEGHQILVAGAVRGGEVKTRWACTVYGVEADYLNTLVSEATSAWQHEETFRDVVRACAATHKLARAHGRTHQF
jgi:hypothetical protein